MQVEEKELDLQITEFKKDVFKELSEKLKQENEKLADINAQQLADLKLTKDCITELLAKIGLVDKNGQFKKMDYLTLSKTIFDIVKMSDAQKAKEFECITKLIPVFEKYKNL